METQRITISENEYIELREDGMIHIQYGNNADTFNSFEGFCKFLLKYQPMVLSYPSNGGNPQFPISEEVQATKEEWDMVSNIMRDGFAMIKGLPSNGFKGELIPDQSGFIPGK